MKGERSRGETRSRASRCYGIPDVGHKKSFPCRNPSPGGLPRLMSCPLKVMSGESFMRGVPLYMEWPPGPVKAGATNQDRYSGYTFNLKPGEGGRVGGKAFYPVGRTRALTYVPFFANWKIYIPYDQDVCHEVLDFPLPVAEQGVFSPCSAHARLWRGAGRGGKQHSEQL